MAEIKTIGDWKEEFIECGKSETSQEITACQVKVREEFKQALSGRLHEMSDTVHSFMHRLDKEHWKAFEDKTLQETADEFGAIEELRIGI